ncbi:YggS family pyridoxal phosphate-dependent enzyme [Jiangella rhizosphaerae]|uniref:Pyridoxal phosphate homeostasis protein n=1 Tax=Jiangella rhizosphaerae TaxID=2293569 RepID=A0A418KWK8_9ACTN|nr:YggS family pyridoxal phosphate-dependent enzyme [Jiangella rhizosphaerae]RIQ35869.1 YggS family pyridoxal phosphate-dependent enzyme [Jiangella rhizosphaerae]
MPDIRDNLAAVRARVDAACVAAGRAPDEVELLLATKTQPAARIAEAIAAGARLIGENRVQELAEKDLELTALAGPKLFERHFIGHLQSNKVNQVLRYVSCVQSVDGVELADRLQRRLETLDRTLDVLVQVNTSGEATKSGVAPAGAVTVVTEVAKRDRLRVRGLMTVGLQSPDEAAVRASYRALRELRDRAADVVGAELPVLSMGMSGDLEAAVAEGATMVRIGSAVFGPRPRPA